MDSRKRDEILTEAVAFYRANDYLSIRKVAKLFKVSHVTLSRRISRQCGSLFDRNVNNARLSPDQETALIQYVNELHHIGVPLRVKAIEHTANSLLAMSHSTQDEPPRVGEHWVTRFLDRHPEIKKMKQKAIELDLLQAANDRQSFTKFYEAYKEQIDKYHITPSHIWNMDEMGLRVGVGRGKWVVVPAEISTKSRHFDNVASFGDTEHSTLIECISVAGKVINPLIILKGKVVQQRWFNNIPKQGQNYLIGVSDTAYSNEIIAYQWIQHFARLTKPRSALTYRLLLLDGHDSHITWEFAQYCYSQRIKLMRLPPHSTHITQPLDVGIFQVWKHYHSEQIDELVRQGIGEFTRQDFLGSIKVIRQLTFKEKVIRSAFRKTGYIPYSPQIILHQLPPEIEQNSQQEEPSNHSDNIPSSPYAEPFETPKSYRVVKKQSKWLRNHQTHSNFTLNLAKFTSVTLSNHLLTQQLVNFSWNSYRIQSQKKRDSSSAKWAQKGGVVYAVDIADTYICVEEVIETFMIKYLNTDQKIWWLCMHTMVLPQMRLK
jgi:DDE superfamily endonuclease/Tc5 transposase DNA-binding domain/helix-turn-helix, Psq domain